MPLARQLVHQRCVHPGPLVLRTAPLKFPTPTTDRDRTVSRRSEPSSRTALMGEQPNPWDRLQPQDAMSRHRGAKPPRRCGLLGEMALVDGFLELERSSGKLEWSAILQKMASDLGFSKILFGLLPKDSQDYENAFIVGNYPAAWREHYDRAGYARVDPTVSHCTQSVLPIFWEPSIYQTRKQHEFFEEASAAGLVYGLTMPLHGARGELGALSLSVEAENRAEANRFIESVLPTLWMLKDYALQSGAGLAFEHPVSKPVVLTSREKEVLQWCAIGKTSWEISVICNCSEANVNFHMGNIRRKFGVTSRRVAAIMAVNLGLITL